ncbi:MAG: phosphopyruvate hydratase [Candidatus Falkowbacteria bacterium]
MVTKIKKISAREILDSRGWPTIEAVVTLDNGIEASSGVPAGSDLNNQETIFKRDGDKARYFGQGVKLTVQTIENVLAPALLGMSPFKQAEIDKIMIDLDGTTDKHKLGSNAILAVSLAVASAAAKSNKQSLHEYLNENFFEKAPMSIPAPILTMFNGGCHADTNLDFQEYLLVLNARADIFQKESRPYAAMLRAGVEIYHSLGSLLSQSDYDTDTGLEGGYAPDMNSSIQALELIMAATITAGYDPKQEARLGIDVGSASLYDEVSGQYVFSLDDNHFTRSNLVGLYNEWLRRFPLVYLEDPLAPEDNEGWQQVSEELGDKLILAGDDLYVTNVNKLRATLKNNLSNAIVIIPGQVGSLTETIECLKLAKRHNYKIVISQRRGETNDDFIADLAVAAAADYLKGGAPVRGERVAKWNRLLILEDIIYGNKRTR